MKTGIFAFLMLINSLANAQATVDWVQVVGEVGIAVDNNNNVYTARYDYNPAGDIYVTKRNASGVQQWQVSYNQTDNSKWEKATWVECDFAGNVLVSGSLMSGYSNPVNAASILMKFSPTGTLLWRVVYENTFDGSYTRKCLVDKANNIYVLGLGSGPNGFVTKVKKFDAAGNALWSYFDNAGIGAAINFKFTPDSNIVIAAKSITGSIMGYAKINRSGSNIWNLPGINSLTSGDLAGDSFGNTYVVHGVYVINGGTTIKKLSPSGTVLWSNDFAMSAFRVEVGTDNMPVVCGFPNQNQVGSTFLKVDANGNQVWFNADADSAYVFLSHAMIKMDQYNNIYLAASIMTNMAMCKVKSNGTTEWVKTFGTGYSQAFRIGADNNVYVTGGATARILQTPPVLPCVAPINLSVTNKTAISAKLNWSAVSNIIRYNVYYKKTTDAGWTKVNVGKTKTSVTINNLICNSTYKWKIRTVCDTVGVNVVSAFSPVINFSTLACRFADDTFETNEAIEVYPNPVSNTATISLRLEKAEDVFIEIDDMAGRKVKELPSLNLAAGENKINIDLSELKRGVYFCKIKLDENFQTVKLMKN